MASRFYVPDIQRAEKVHDLFAAVAARYDLINDLQSFGLHRRWKRRVVDLACVQPGDRALDVCCGTGDIAFELARRGAQVVGVDFSEPMLAVAGGRRQKADRGDNPQFIRADAMCLPFPDNSFEVVTVGYGLRNMASWQTGLCEMHRVARPGARLLALDFGKPDHPLWRAVYFATLRVYVPLLGLAVCGHAGAYAYIFESLKHYAAQRGVAEKMRELGLVEVQTINLLGGAMSITRTVKAGGS